MIMPVGMGYIDILYYALLFADAATAKAVGTYDNLEIHKRARDVSYDEAVTRGKSLICALNDGANIPATWTKYSDIVDQKFDPDVSDIGPGSSDADMHHVLDVLKIDNDKSWIEWIAEPTFDPKAKQNPEYSFLFSHKHAMMVMQSTYNADPPVKDKISRVSDLAYLAWKQTTPKGADYKNPKYFVPANINNPSTTAILNNIFGPGEDKKDLEQYNEKGTPIKFDDEHGLALLGSPTGIAAAWILINHRGDFPKKTLDNVRVFGTNEEFEMLTFVFEIIDTPPKARNLQRRLGRSPNAKPTQTLPDNGFGTIGEGDDFRDAWID